LADDIIGDKRAITHATLFVFAVIEALPDDSVILPGSFSNSMSM
jgi:hypothetical protein